MRPDEAYVAATAGVMVALLALQFLRGRFDPFAPVWLFLVGYLHVYVVQATALRDWAVTVHGDDVVAAANFRSLWALVWYLVVYHCRVGDLLARLLPKPPTGWSTNAVTFLAPALIVWGLYCAYAVILQGLGEDASEVSAEVSLLRSFPFVMLFAGVLLVVTGKSGPGRQAYFWGGVGVVLCYILIWMFNGKRSHSVIGVLAGLCAVYVARGKRPSLPVLAATAFVGAMVVALAIGWRNNPNYERSVSGFLSYLADFEPGAITRTVNPAEREEENVGPNGMVSFETEEYGGFLVMFTAVPEKADYDYGASYMRVISTFIPRIVWASKPYYGRDEWRAAWIAGSEFERDEEFTGPAIGILGAAQLNGGAVGTLVVMAAVALMHRTSYAYFLRHAGVPWVQAFWALTYYNAWMMVVNDDPMVWFYYNWGLTCMPNFILLWVVNKAAGARDGVGVAVAAA